MMFSHKEEYALNKLLPEYVSLYHIDLNSGKYEILRIASNTNEEFAIIVKGNEAVYEVLLDLLQFSKKETVKTIAE